MSSNVTLTVRKKTAKPQVDSRREKSGMGQGPRPSSCDLAVIEKGFDFTASELPESRRGVGRHSVDVGLSPPS